MAVFDTIKKASEGNFEGGGVTTYGLKEDGVGLGKISPKFTDQAIIDQVEAQKQKIIDGEIQIPETVS